MSSPYSATFLKAWRRAAKQPLVLVKIELTVPGSQTVRIGSGETFTPDGEFWQAGLHSGSPVRDPGEVFEPGPDLSSCDITLQKMRLGFQAAGKTVENMLSDFQLYGATVTVYLYERSLLALSEAPAQRFKGTVNRAKMTPFGLQLFLIQPRAWNKMVPDVLVSKAGYPNAPDSSLGKPLPWLIGDHRSLGLRVPWPAAYGDDKRRHEHVGGASLWTPGVVVDRGGLGANSLKVLFAGHKCENNFAPSSGNGGMRQYILNTPHGSAIASNATTKVNTATEAGVLINDDVGIAYCPALPVDVHITGGTSGNTALNPRQAFDTNESSYAYLDQDQGTTALDLYLPQLAPLGAWISTTWAIGFRTDTSGGADDAGFSIGIYDITTDAYVHAKTITPSTTATSDEGNFPINTLGGWDMSTGVGTRTGDSVCLRVCFKSSLGATLGAHQKVRVYFVGLFLNYRPTQDFLLAQRVVSFNPHWIGNWDQPALTVSFTQPGDEFRSLFAGNLIGKVDDNTDGFSAGDMTGSASATIERTGDAAKWILCRGGGFDPTNDFENGSTAFASFVAARSALHPVPGYDFVHSLAMTEQRRISDWVRLLAQDSLSTIWLDPFDNKWRIRFWQDGESVDYDHTFRAEELGIFEVDETSDTDIENALRVKYGYEPATKQYLFDTFINPNGSDDGAPAGGAGSQLEVTGFTIASCTVTSGSRVVTGSGFTTGATALTKGMGVFAASGVPQNAVVVSVQSNTQFTMSQDATATPGAQTLTFTNNGSLWINWTTNPWIPTGNLNQWTVGSIPLGVYTHESFCKTMRDYLSVDYARQWPSKNATEWQINHGFLVTDENKYVRWKLKGSAGGLYDAHNVTLTKQRYTTGALLAAEIQSKLQTDIGAAGVFAVTCDATTGLFNWTLTGTSAPTTGFEIVEFGSTAVGSYDNNFCSLVGLTHGSGHSDTSAPFSITSDAARYPDFFYISAESAFAPHVIGWATAPTNCQQIIGATDTADFSGSEWAAGAKRGTGIDDAGDSAGTYGEKGEVPYYAESIRDWRSAVDYRDRRLAFKKATRKLVRFASRMCPDLQRGRIIEFDADCNTLHKYTKYGSDGSWAGKKFRVVSVAQPLMGEMWTEAFAIELV